MPRPKLYGDANAKCITNQECLVGMRWKRALLRELTSHSKSTLIGLLSTKKY